MNALAAIAAADHVGVPPAEAARALGSFRNVRRRMELRGTVERSGGSITVYDDFAHHPTAIRTTLDGLRNKLDAAGKKSERILAAFEPRSNTMKLGVMAAQLPWSLEAADLSFCHTAGLDWDVAAALAPMGERAQLAGAIEPLVNQIVAAARPGDHIVCMSNGGFGGVHDKLLAALKAAATLKLQPHPEGGWYKEVFRSVATVSPTDGRATRNALTSIYFLLEADQQSRWHRVLSDEAWVHLEGVPLALWTCDAAMRTAPAHVKLGPVDAHGTRPQHVVPA
eukprot:gene12260-16349_t